jgi:predicted dehydrogenase
MPGEGIFSMGSSWNWDGSMLPAGTWHNNPPNIRIHGTHGALRIFPYANKLYWMTPGKTEEIRGVAERPAPGNFAIQMEGIVAALRSGREPPITGYDGYKSLEAVLAAYQSYEKHEVVQFADCKK